jgi:hypothetical protein
MILYPAGRDPATTTEHCEACKQEYEEGRSRMMAGDSNQIAGSLAE